MKNAKGNLLEGIFHLNEDADNPIDDVTELHYKVNEEPLGYARHELPDATWLMPGRSTRAMLTFIRPDPVLSSLGVGLKLDAYCGTRKIGTLHITGVSTPLFGGGTDALAQTRLEPRSLARTGVTILTSVVYLVFVVLTVYLAVKAYDPCESNFEGGCSMGRSLMAIASMVPAATATILGVLVKRQMDKFSALASWRLPIAFCGVPPSSTFSSRSTPCFRASQTQPGRMALCCHTGRIFIKNICHRARMRSLITEAPVPVC